MRFLLALLFEFDLVSFTILNADQHADIENRPVVFCYIYPGIEGRQMCMIRGLKYIYSWHPDNGWARYRRSQYL